MEDALIILAEHFDTTTENIFDLLNKNFKSKCYINKNIESNNDKQTEIILPYYGEIVYDNCKHLIYNHGLFTQCKEKVTEGNSCKKCKKNKYGTVFDRQKYNIGKYITPSGKKELDYNNFIIRMNYNVIDVQKIFKKLKINYPLTVKNEYNRNIEKRQRGRPCKKNLVENNKIDENVSIEVEKKIIDGVEYLITGSSIVLDSNSYEILGVLELNNLILY